MLSTLAIVPARKNSKRLPGKNMKPLAGIPLIMWTITAALASNQIDGLVVSSDWDELLEMCTNYGISCIERPSELATDFASSYDVMKHAYHSLENQFDLMCLLQPTSPLRSYRDIDNCIYMAYNTDMPCVVSAEEGKTLANGAVYVGRTGWILDGGRFDYANTAPNGLVYRMPRERSIDIDTIEDFNEAERIIDSWSR